MRRILKYVAANFAVYLASFGLCIGFTGGRFVDRPGTGLFNVYYPLIRGYSIIFFGWNEDPFVRPQREHR